MFEMNAEQLGATESPRRPLLPLGFSLDAKPPVSCGGNDAARPMAERRSARLPRRSGQAPLPRRKRA